jgi:hypothetical protein
MQNVLSNRRQASARIYDVTSIKTIGYTYFEPTSFFLKKKEVNEITLLSILVCPPNVARQRLCKYVPAARNTHAAMDELLDAVLSMLPILYKILSM